MKEINYLSENPTPEYVKAIRKAKSLAQLLQAISFYKKVADDAFAQVKKMEETDFYAFKKDLPKFKKATGEEAERLNRMWGKIVLPKKLLISSLVADQFHTPWGCAFIRCKEEKWKF